MKELLVATTNPAKLAEYQLLLRDFGLTVISLREIGIAQAAPEDAASFAENAAIKARFYFDLARVPTLADDGGLEVDALDGAPGVRSHRWLGVANPDDRMLAEEVIRRMTGVAPERRTARIRAAAALTWFESAVQREARAEAALEGVIADRCYHEVRAGFPYRSVLWLPERGCYLAELSEEEAAQLSQRRAVIERLSRALTGVATARE
ncbi:MAG TPA: non-canonical purine NTP pyrophosphatase [Candidatus Binataceae bacterium]|nr:non-canonical purine NTP pyrophosphatase [Candidatus Binataceae bacterium]